MNLRANRQNKGIRKPAAGILPVLFAVLIAFPALAAAATLTDYHSRLQSARANIKDLLDSTKTGPANGGRNTDYETGVIAEIKKSLPPTEKIEWKAAAAETGNQWLYDKIGEFQSQKDRAKRIVILTAIDERLWALESDVKAFEEALAADRTKDEDKQKLDEILRREEFQRPQQKEESLFQRWTREIMEWLAKMFPRVNMPESSGGGFQGLSMVLQILLYALVIGAIGFIIYKFAPFLFGRYSGRVKKEKKDRVILGELISADESAESLFGEAEGLAREGDLRGAIRKGYIALLCELSDRKVIGLAQHKTNRDYLRDVRNRGELYDNVNGLTTSFERHWYGFQSAEMSDWDEFRQNFRRAVGSS
jgi:hypothetical protein